MAGWDIARMRMSMRMSFGTLCHCPCGVQAGVDTCSYVGISRAMTWDMETSLRLGS